MLQSASFRVKVTQPDFQVSSGENGGCGVANWEIELGDILEVLRREQDSDLEFVVPKQNSEDTTILIVYPWFERDLFFTFYERHACPFMIDVRYTEPTLDV